MGTKKTDKKRKGKSRRKKGIAISQPFLDKPTALSGTKPLYCGCIGVPAPYIDIFDNQQTAAQYQDEAYGQGMRIHNPVYRISGNSEWRCTCCGKSK